MAARKGGGPALAWETYVKKVMEDRGWEGEGLWKVRKENW
jgi:hypothetical protein